jgi:molybdopterin-binding protein
MRLSARNVLKGRIVDVLLGATTARVKIAIEGGATITASITVEAASPEPCTPSFTLERHVTRD